MMSEATDPILRVVEELKSLPGIGPKSAQRLAYAILRKTPDEIRRLADSIVALTTEIHLCSVCANLTDTDPCRICGDAGRDRRVVCVVESPFNIQSIEKTGEYRGLYHVLHGALSPMQGIGPGDLRIDSLVSRVQSGEIGEVIVATNPNAEGETTALYLAKILKPMAVRVSRIAMGLPVGSDLEFADQVTMARSLEGRRDL
jgi:recombination protein RecR